MPVSETAKSVVEHVIELFNRDFGRGRCIAECRTYASEQDALSAVTG